MGLTEEKFFLSILLGQTVQGIVAYPSIDRVPSKVDLAIIATPAHTVPQIVEECGEAGVLNAVIVSAGFDECSKVGRELTQRILECKKAYGLKDNWTKQLWHHKTKFQSCTQLLRKRKRVPGKIAFISQSGAFCGSALDWSLETQVGFSAVVSMGQTIDVDVGDLIEYFGNDCSNTNYNALRRIN